MRLFNRLLFVVFCLIANSALAGTAHAYRDRLLKINRIYNDEQRQKALFTYVDSVFLHAPVDSLAGDKAAMSMLLDQYEKPFETAYDYFIENVCLQRNQHFSEAQNPLVRALDQASRDHNHYLSYTFLSQLAFLQTYLGNTIDAVSSFRLANIEVIKLNDPYLRTIIDINISDLYYRIGLYSQSLFFLSQAQSLLALHDLDRPGLKNIIDYNIAENYFRMKNADSLAAYKQKLDHETRGTSRIYNYRKRVAYYLEILDKKYADAAKEIFRLEKDPRYSFDNDDRLNLADTYFHAYKLDSAENVITQLLNNSALRNHPEIKFHLYTILGEIAVHRNQSKDAVNDFNLAVQQSEENISRLNQVGHIASLIKTDELHYSYLKREALYHRERLIMIFLIVATLLVIGILILIYHNLRQKRGYEKLLFAAQKEELAFISSHEIRRHLSNIYGMIDLIRNSENREEEYAEMEDYLFGEVKNLDSAIKTISKKLDN